MTARVLRQTDAISTTPQCDGLDDSTRWWPLSLSQEAQLISDELRHYAKVRPHPAHFPVALWIRGPLYLDALQAALDAVVHRHPGLRASYLPTETFDERDRRLMLGVFARRRLFVPGLLFGQRLSLDARVRIEHRKATPVQGVLDEEHLARAAEEEAREPLPVDVAPVLRATAITLDRGDHLLVLTVSHLLVDGWSAGILREELIALYTSIVSGEPVALPPVTSHVGESAVTEHRRLRSGEFGPHAEYWRQQWSEAADALIPHGELPCARRGAAVRPSVRAVKRMIGAPESQHVRVLAREHRITAYVFFRAAFTLLLHRYTGRRRVAFWANFANRTDPKSSRMIASCARPHLVTVDLRGDPTVIELCRCVAARLGEAQRYAALAESACPLAGVPPLRANSARITFDSWPSVQVSRADPLIAPVVSPAGRPWVDFDFRFRDQGREFAFYVTYNERRYERHGVIAMLRDFAILVSCLVGATNSRMSELGVNAGA